MNLFPRSLVRVLKGMTVATLLTLCLVFGASASQPGTILVDQVNLRNEPSTDASIVNWLNAGDTVNVLDTSTEGWVKVSYTVDSTKYVGYVSAEFIEVGISTNDTPTVNNAGITQTATITGGGVRVRKEPNTDSAILALVADGKVVTILDDSSVDGWIKVSFEDNGQTVVGFIASDYLYTNPMATGVTARSSIILRESSDNSSPILAILPADAELDILDEEGSMELPVEGGNRLSVDYVGGHFANYDSFLVLSHFKGHAMAGFGGAIKNISIGFGSQEGKVWIHSGGTRKTGSIFDESRTRSWSPWQTPRRRWTRRWTTTSSTSAC